METKTSRNAQDQEKLIEYICAEIMDKATVADALDSIPIKIFLQLVENQAKVKAKKVVEEMPDDEFDKLVAQVKASNAGS